MDTKQLLEQRGQQYGETHFLVGVVIKVLGPSFVNFVLDYPELVYHWIKILSKLIRILYSPTKMDHYDDIMGYATLAKGVVERMYKDESDPATR